MLAKTLQRPSGPRKAKEGSEDNRPGWARRYHVAEDANRPGEYFIADTRTNGLYLNEDPAQAGSFSQALSRRGLRSSTAKNFTSREDAEKHIAQIEVNRNHSVRNIGTSDNPNYAIVRQISDRKSPTVRDGFKSAEEARAHMKANAEAVIEHEFPHYEKYQYLDSVRSLGRQGASTRRQGR